MICFIELLTHRLERVLKGNQDLCLALPMKKVRNFLKEMKELVKSQPKKLQGHILKLLV